MAAMTPLDRGEQYFRRVLEHVPDAVIATDTYGQVTFANSAAQELYGIDGEDALGHNIAELLAMFDTEGRTDVDDITAMVARDGQWHGELTQRSLDGRDLLVEVSVSRLQNHDGTVQGSVSMVREISDRKAAERHISYQATHDGLTGLLNRTAFLAELDSSVTSGRNPTLVFLDLNGFKAINDLHGHHQGDEILRVIGGRLAGAIRPDDAAGRFGGDEFVLLVHGLTEQTATESYLERIMTILTDPVRARGGAWHIVGVSVGVAHFRPEDNPDRLIRRADQAMYDAKRSTEVASAYRTAGRGA